MMRMLGCAALVVLVCTGLWSGSGWASQVIGQDLSDRADERAPGL